MKYFYFEQILFPFISEVRIRFYHITALVLPLSFTSISISEAIFFDHFFIFPLFSKATPISSHISFSGFRFMLIFLWVFLVIAFDWPNLTSLIYELHLLLLRTNYKECLIMFLFVQEAFVRFISSYLYTPFDFAMLPTFLSLKQVNHSKFSIRLQSRHMIFPTTFSLFMLSYICFMWSSTYPPNL